MPPKPISFRIAAVVALMAGLVVLGFLWQRHSEQVAAVVRVSVPEIPDLSAWPSDYAARVRVATAAARSMEQTLQALGELACLYHANGSYREARQLEQGLHTLRPRDPQWVYLLADAYQNLGDAEEQSACLEQMLRLVPSYPVTRLKLAELLFKQGKIDEAYTHYEWRLTFVPGDPYAQLGMARIALQRGNRAEAVRLLESLVRQSPEFSTAHNLLAGIYERMGARDKAEQQRQLGSSTGRFVEANDPRLYKVYAWSFNPMIVDAYGQTAAQPRQWDGILSFYKSALSHFPDELSTYEALGGLYARLGRNGDAREVLRRGLDVAKKKGDTQAVSRLEQAIAGKAP